MPQRVIFMKKILSVILIMLSVMAISASSDMLTISEGDIDGVKLYAPDGSVLDAFEPVGKNGMVIQTDGDGKRFTSLFGDIYLKDDSLLAITGYEDASPSLYLVYGDMSLTLTSDISLTVYTPSIAAELPGRGEYVFTSTDTAELFMNFSDNDVTVLDGLRNIRENVPSMSTLDLLAWPRIVSEASAAEYYANSSTGDKVIFDEPAEPVFEEPVVEVIPEEPVIEEPVVIAELETEEEVIPEKQTTPYAPIVLEPSIVIGEEEEVSTPSAPVVFDPIIAIEETAEIEEPAIPAKPTVSMKIAIEEPVQTTVAEAETEPGTESTSEEIPESPSQEVSSTAEKAMPFDLRIYGRAYADIEGNKAITASVQPYFYVGAFTLGLNIDPYEIYETVKNYDTYSISDWIGFGASLISEISYENDILSVRADRYTLLAGDMAGLTTDKRHEWDGMYSALSFNHTLDTEYYSHRVWFDDLSFSREKYGQPVGAGGAEISFSVGNAYPISLTIGLTTEITPNTIKDTMLYPAVGLYVPFIYSESVDFGLKATAAVSFESDNFTFKPFPQHGMLITALLPVSVGGFYGEIGSAYSTDGMHYGMIGNTLFTPERGDYISVIAKAGYSCGYFGIEGHGWLDIDLDKKAISGKNSYAEVNAYAQLYGLKVLGGFRTTFSDFKNAYQYYAGVGADLGPMESRMLLGYNSEDRFSLTFTGSISALGRDKEKTYYDSDFPVRGSLELGFRYDFGNDKTTMLITPHVVFGNEDYMLALRAPLEMEYWDGTFVLAGFNGHSIWNFGLTGTANDNQKIYRIVTDTFALIDRIKLGDAEDTLLYLLADRDYIKNGTLFTDFGSENSLSLRAGFNFPNLSLGVYVDNAEAPHIVEGSLAFYPSDSNGFALRFNVPGEMLIKDLKNYALLFYPEIRMDFPFADKSVMFSIYALGKISTVYKDGEMKSANIIYDFGNNRMEDWMAGAAFTLDFDVFALNLEGGVRSGRLAPDMFNEFTLMRHDTAGTLIELVNPQSVDLALKGYGKASFDILLDNFTFSFAYTAADVMAFVDKAPEDFLSVAVSGTISDTTTLYASFAKENFVPSLFEKKDFLGYMKNDTIFRIGADFSFGHAGFTAELATRFVPDATDPDEYINITKMSADSTVALTIKSRISF